MVNKKILLPKCAFCETVLALFQGTKTNIHIAVKGDILISILETMVQRYQNGREKNKDIVLIFKL